MLPIATVTTDPETAHGTTDDVRRTGGVWFTGLDDAVARIDRAVSALHVQFGRAAGTLAAVHPHGLAMADALAAELGLARQVAPWHTTRTPVAGLASGAVSKPATDIIAIASTEFGEVAKDAPSGSSAMPHKQNPVSAIAARAAARRVSGLVSMILASIDLHLGLTAAPLRGGCPAFAGLGPAPRSAFALM